MWCFKSSFFRFRSYIIYVLSDQFSWDSFWYYICPLRGVVPFHGRLACWTWFSVVNLKMTFHVNIYLGVFNLFPFPPLDGSKILGLFVPKAFHRQYMNYLENGMKYFVAIILVDVFILPDFLGYSVFRYVMGILHEKIALILGRT